MSVPVSAPRCWVVIPAAGTGQRMAAHTPKQYLPLAGATVIEHALAPFLDHPRISAVVVVLAAQDREFRRLACAGNAAILTATGGEERGRSVLNGLQALARRAAADDWVLVHDAARPCLTRADVDRLIKELGDEKVGGLLAIPVGDTLKREDSGRGRSAGSVGREGVWRAQTPQMFRFDQLREALRRAMASGNPPTDEASAIEALGLRPRLVPGSPQNIKITQAEDLQLAAAILAARNEAMKVGTGFDAHRFGEGDHVMLGGVRVAHTRGVVAHSDGDVVIHALCDALLGAAGLGDIGVHFPDADARWRGAASSLFLGHVMQMLAERGLRPINVDVTLLAEEPRLAPHREAIRSTLAGLLRLPADAVNLKATTLEEMGFIGRGEGLAAQAIASVGSIGVAHEPPTAKKVTAPRSARASAPRAR